MKLVITATVSEARFAAIMLRGPIGETFALASRYGYDGIEVLVDHRWDSRDPAYLQTLSREYALPIVALHSPFVLNVPGWPFDQLGRLECTVSLAGVLDVPVVVTHLPFRVGPIRRFALRTLFSPAGQRLMRWRMAHKRRTAVARMRRMKRRNV